MLRRTALGAALILAATLVALAPGQVRADPVPVSPPGADAGQPVVVVDDAGTTILAWVREDAAGDSRVEVASKPPGGPWSEVRTLSPAGVPAFQPRLAVAADGTVVAAWTYGAGNNVARVQSAVRSPGGVWGPVLTLSGPDLRASQVRVAVDDAGNATVVWVEDLNPSRVVVRRRAPSGLWVPLGGLSPTAYVGDLELVAAPGGAVTALWTTDAGGGDLVVRARTAADGVTWGPATDLDHGFGDAIALVAGVDDAGTVTALWEDSTGLLTTFVAGAELVGGAWAELTSPAHFGSPYHKELSLAVAPDGSRIASWIYDHPTFGDVVEVRHWPAGAGFWGNTAQVSTLGAFPRNPRPGFAAAGQGVVVWEEFVLGAFVVRMSTGVPGSGWQPAVTVSSTSGTPHDTRVATTPGGDSLLTWVRTLGAHDRVELEAIDRTAPRATPSGLPPVTVSPRVSVGWTPFDAWSAVHGVVRVRTLPWNGAGWTPWTVAADSPSASAVVPVGPGTSCFTVQPRDVAGNTGAETAPVCTTTPVDDRVAKGRGWKVRSSATAHLGSYRQATRKGATLTLAGARARSVDLVVHRVRGGGKVAVLLGRKRLGKVSLAGRGQAVVPVGVLPAEKQGRLRIVVLSSGRPVRIDGIVLRR